VRFPNFWYVPDVRDFSRDNTFWNYYWPISATFVPLPFLALFRNAFHQSLHLMMYVVLLAGFTGWITVATELGVSRRWRLAFGIFLLAHLISSMMLEFYMSDIFAYTASPWMCFLLLRLTGNFQKAPETVSISKFGLAAFVFGLMYPIKFSAFSSGLADLFLLLGWVALPWKSRSRARAIRGLTALALFAVPVFGCIFWSAYFSGTGKPTDEYGRVALWAAESFPRWREAFFLPGDLILPTEKFLEPQSRYYGYFAVLLYLLALVSRTRLGPRLAYFVFGFVGIPVLVLLYVSLMGQSGLFVARYRFAFAPFAFLLFVFPLRKQDHFRTGLAVVALAILLVVSVIPATRYVARWAAALGTSQFTEEWQRDPVQRVTQSTLLIPSTRAILERLSTERSPESILVTAFDNQGYQLLALLRGRVMVMDFYSRCLFGNMRPYYKQSGIDYDAIIGHPWRTSRDRDLYLLISSAFYDNGPAMTRFKAIFPQVMAWREVARERDFLVLFGRAQAGREAAP